MDNVGSGVETVDVGCDDDCGCCLLVVVDVVIVFVSSETITVDATGGVIVIVVVVSEESMLMLMLLLINLPLVPLVLVVVYHVLFIGSGHFYIQYVFNYICPHSKIFGTYICTVRYSPVRNEQLNPVNIYDSFFFVTGIKR